jgi:hypothetical protein
MELDLEEIKSDMPNLYSYIQRIPKKNKKFADFLLSLDREGMMNVESFLADRITGRNFWLLKRLKKFCNYP